MFVQKLDYLSNGIFIYLQILFILYLYIVLANVVYEAINFRKYIEYCKLQLVSYTRCFLNNRY